MEKISDVCYFISQWANSATETEDIDEVKLAIREGWDVVKRTRCVFQSGASNVYLTVMTDIKKIKDI